MDHVQLILESLEISLLGVVVIPNLPASARAAASFLTILVNAILTSLPAFAVLSGHPIEAVLYGPPFLGDVALRMDALSAWFVLIVNFTCVNGALYGIGYMKTYRDQRAKLSLHWPLFVVFQVSMLWVCLLQHGLAFLIAWELMSLSSLLLVMFEHEKKDTLRAGINYMVQMHVGVVLLTVAFIWVYFTEGSFDFAAIGSFFEENKNIWLFLLFFGGFGIKAGFIPLHTWLPHAHPAAPAHVSGVMSGVVVKMGIYGLLRVGLLLKTDLLLLGAGLLALSVLTGIYGILSAALRRDFKMMLAYCTIENIGIIGAGIGLFLIGKGLESPILAGFGLSAALLHTLNHSLYKSLLFFAAGSVYQQTHTRDMEQLGGLVGKMPQTAVFFLLGSLAISGLPPLNGFVSEFLLYRGFLEGLQLDSFYLSTLLMLSLAGLAIIGGISMLAFTKSFGVIFLGVPRIKLTHEPHEVAWVMRLPQYLIVALMVAIGLFPQLFLECLFQIEGLPEQQAGLADLTAVNTTLHQVSGYSLGFFAVLLLVFFLRKTSLLGQSSSVGSTWGCGYVAPNSRMQYTGKSFSKTLGKLLGFIVCEKKQYAEINPDEIFPRKRSYNSHYNDFFENNLIDQLTHAILRVMDWFKFIQNGRIQYYVLYGAIFILLLIVGTMMNLIG